LTEKKSSHCAENRRRHEESIGGIRDPFLALTSFEVAVDAGSFWHFTRDKISILTSLNVSEMSDAWEIVKLWGELLGHKKTMLVLVSVRNGDFEVHPVRRIVDSYRKPHQLGYPPNVFASVDQLHTKGMPEHMWAHLNLGLLTQTLISASRGRKPKPPIFPLALISSKNLTFAHNVSFGLARSTEMMRITSAPTRSSSKGRDTGSTVTHSLERPLYLQWQRTGY